MLDKNKVAEKLAEKSAPVAGPPGTKKLDGETPKVNKTVQKQLAKLIGATAEVPTNDAPKQATTAPKGKAMKWATKKFGAEGLATMAAGTGMSVKKWAKAKYAEHIAAKEKEAKPNEATQALIEGSKKRAAKKQEAQERDKAIDTAILSLKVTTNQAFENALRGFIDGPCKAVLDSFVTLFASRNTDGESDEAVLALDACKKAFDACGLLLVDVKTSAKKSKTSSVAAAIARGELDPSSSETGRLLEEETAKKSKKASKKSERVRKPLTKEQRDAKNKKDRERRAKKSKASKK